MQEKNTVLYDGFTEKEIPAGTPPFFRSVPCRESSESYLVAL